MNQATESANANTTASWPGRVQKIAHPLMLFLNIRAPALEIAVFVVSRRIE